MGDSGSLLRLSTMDLLSVEIEAFDRSTPSIFPTLQKQDSVLDAMQFLVGEKIEDQEKQEEEEREEECEVRADQEFSKRRRRFLPPEDLERKLRNRESAKRSRERKQQEWQQLLQSNRILRRQIQMISTQTQCLRLAFASELERVHRLLALEHRVVKMMKEGSLAAKRTPLLRRVQSI